MTDTPKNSPSSPSVSAIHLFLLGDLMYVLCQLTFIGKTVVTGSNGMKGGGEEKNEAMTGYILIVTYLPLYRLLGALLYPPTPSLRNHFHAKKKNMLAQAIYFYVWEVIIIVGLP